MKRYGHRAAAAVSLLCTMFVGLPVSAHDGKRNKVDAKLYEVTENMSLDNLSMPTLRTATAALQGTAKLGSPLCPVRPDSSSRRPRAADPHRQAVHGHRGGQ